MASFHLQIITADGLKFDGQADRLVIRTTEGDIAILRGHVDYFAALRDVSELCLTIDGDTRTAAVSGGFVSVTRDITRLNAITLEWADEIDVQRARRALKEAEQIIKESRQKQQDYRWAEIKRKRAANRIRIAESK